MVFRSNETPAQLVGRGLCNSSYASAELILLGQHADHVDPVDTGSEQEQSASRAAELENLKLLSSMYSVGSPEILTTLLLSSAQPLCPQLLPEHQISAHHRQTSSQFFRFGGFFQFLYSIAFQQRRAPSGAQACGRVRQANGFRFLPLGKCRDSGSSERDCTSGTSPTARCHPAPTRARSAVLPTP